MNKTIYILLLLFNALLSAFSQVLLKKAAVNNNKSLFLQYINLTVISAYLIYVIVLMVNIYAMRFLSIGIVTTFSETLPLLFTIFASKLFFNESINTYKVIGAIIVVIGVVLVLL